MQFCGESGSTPGGLYRSRRKLPRPFPPKKVRVTFSGMDSSLNDPNVKSINKILLKKPFKAILLTQNQLIFMVNSILYYILVRSEKQLQRTGRIGDPAKGEFKAIAGGLNRPMPGRRARVNLRYMWPNRGPGKSPRSVLWMERRRLWPRASEGCSLPPSSSTGEGGKGVQSGLNLFLR